MIIAPYLTWQMSPTTMSLMRIWCGSPLRKTLSVCSPSMRACRPRNCRSFRQSLKAVTSTTASTAAMIAVPSIQLALDSLESRLPEQTEAVWQLQPKVVRTVQQRVSCEFLWMRAARHVPIFSRMFTISCCLLIGLGHGLSSNSCSEYHCWHRLGHGPAMGSKTAAACLCRMRKLIVFFVICSDYNS